MYINEYNKAMNRYNLSQIMSDAHRLRSNRPEKYQTFSLALKSAWRLAKSRNAREANRAETEAFFAAQKQAAREKAERIAQTEARRAEQMKEATYKQNEAAKIESECFNYGYGRGNHYNMYSGWGNYCGD